MMPMSYEVTETGNRRAAVWSIALHSVGMAVASKNLELYPVYCEEMGVTVKRREKTLNRPFGHDADVV